MDINVFILFVSKLILKHSLISLTFKTSPISMKQIFQHQQKVDSCDVQGNEYYIYIFIITYNICFPLIVIVIILVFFSKSFITLLRKLTLSVWWCFRWIRTGNARLQELTPNLPTKLLWIYNAPFSSEPQTYIHISYLLRA